MKKADIVAAITRKLMNEGRLMEAGWAAFSAFVIPVDASPIQRAAMREAFFSGAQHLWGCIHQGLDEDAEPTEADERRMSLINAELEVFAKEMQAKIEAAKAARVPAAKVH